MALYHSQECHSQVLSSSSTYLYSTIILIAKHFHNESRPHVFWDFFKKVIHRQRRTDNPYSIITDTESYGCIPFHWSKTNVLIPKVTQWANHSYDNIIKPAIWGSDGNQKQLSCSWHQFPTDISSTSCTVCTSFKNCQHYITITDQYTEWNQ